MALATLAQCSTELRGGQQKHLEEDEKKYLQRELKFRILLERCDTVRNLIDNAWRLNLLDVAHRAGLDPDQGAVQGQFLAFQEAARLLRSLSPAVLAVICAPTNEVSKDVAPLVERGQPAANAVQ